MAFKFRCDAINCQSYFKTEFKKAQTIKPSNKFKSLQSILKERGKLLLGYASDLLFSFIFTLTLLNFYSFSVF